MSAADLAEAQFAQAVERLHGLGSRALLEFLAELGARHLLRTEIKRLVVRYAQIDSATLTAVGGDRSAPASLHGVAARLQAALGHLHEAESGVGGDPGVTKLRRVRAHAREDFPRGFRLR